MEAKDTVIDLHGLTVGEVGVANQQAEISFKAGVKHECLEWLNADTTTQLEKAKRVAIREVVEWVEKNGIVPNHIPFANIEIQHHPWQAQKKVWGIKDGS